MADTGYTGVYFFLYFSIFRGWHEFCGVDLVHSTITVIIFFVNLNNMRCGCCDRHFGRVMWIDNDECAFGTRCMGGTCQNLIAKGVSDRGFQCKWNAHYVTIFFDQVCSRESIEGMTYINTSTHAQLASLDVSSTIAFDL